MKFDAVADGWLNIDAKNWCINDIPVCTYVHTHNVIIHDSIFSHVRTFTYICTHTCIHLWNNIIMWIKDVQGYYMYVRTYIIIHHSMEIYMYIHAYTY